MPRWIEKGRERLTHRHAEQLAREAANLQAELANRRAVLYGMRIRRVDDVESRAA